MRRRGRETCLASGQMVISVSHGGFRFWRGGPVPTPGSGAGAGPSIQVEGVVKPLCGTPR